MFIVQHSTLDTYLTALASSGLHVAPPWVQIVLLCTGATTFMFLYVTETGTVFEKCGIYILKDKQKEEWINIYVSVSFHFILFCSGGSASSSSSN
jgi:hypothetical protein